MRIRTVASAAHNGDGDGARPFVGKVVSHKPAAFSCVVFLRWIAGVGAHLVGDGGGGNFSRGGAVAPIDHETFDNAVAIDAVEEDVRLRGVRRSVLRARCPRQRTDRRGEGPLVGPGGPSTLMSIGSSIVGSGLGPQP